MTIYDELMLGAQKISFVWRIVLCLIFPPLAVFDKGCLPVGLVYFLSCLGYGTSILCGLGIFSLLTGWIPAALVALLICATSEEKTRDDGNDVPDIAVGNEPPLVPMSLTGKDICVLIIRYFLCLFCPPLAVLDKGCGAALYVLAFLPFGGIPGIILAFLICARSNNYYRKPAESD